MGQNLVAFESSGVAKIGAGATGTAAGWVAVIAAVGYHTFDVTDSHVVTAACTTDCLCSDSCHPKFDYFTAATDDDLHGIDFPLDHSKIHH